MNDSPRRVLLLTRNFPPMWGGMERLNWHIAEALSRRGELCVIAPPGAVRHAPPGIEVREVPLEPLPRFLLKTTREALRRASDFRPDLVLAGSGLTAPSAWLAARRSRARAAVYVHGLDLAVPHPVYRRVWLPVMRRLDRVIANSRATAALAVKAGIRPERITVVHPGTDLPALDPEARQRFRVRHQLGERPVLLSVGRLTRRKGLREFVQRVLPAIVSERPETMLLIVGDVPAQALYAQAQPPQSLFAAAEAAGIAGHVRFLGVITDKAELSTVYQAADVHVFPVQDIPDDPEGFGMVAIEAAAHGLPTVAYAVGGVPDAIGDDMSGALIAPGDEAAFAAAVLKLLTRPIPRERVRAFASRFAWPRFAERLWASLELDPARTVFSPETKDR